MQLLFSGQTFGVCPLLQAVLIHNILAVYYQFYVFTSVTLCYSHSQSIALSRSFLTNYLSLITISVYFCLFKAHVSFLDTQYTSGMTRCILQYTGNFLTDENISTVAASTPNKPNGPSYTAKPKKKNNQTDPEDRNKHLKILADSFHKKYYRDKTKALTRP